MRCEHCHTDNSEGAAKCQSCQARLDAALHGELALVNEVIQSLSKKNVQQTSVSRLLSQNLKRKDQILSQILVDDAAAKTLPFREMGSGSDVNMPTVKLSDSEEIVESVTRKMSASQPLPAPGGETRGLADEREETRALPAADDTSAGASSSPVDADKTGVLPPPRVLAPGEETEMRAAPTVRINAEESVLLSESEVDKLARDLQAELRAVDDTVSIPAGFTDSPAQHATQPLPPESMPRARYARVPPIFAPHAHEGVSVTATVWTAIAAGAGVALFFAAFRLPAPAGGALLGGAGLALHTLAMLGMGRWTLASVNALRLAGILMMPLAVMSWAGRGLLPISYAQAAAAGFLAGGALGMLSVRRAAWTGAASMFVFAAVAALFAFRLGGLTNFYETYPSVTLLGLCLAVIAAGLSVARPVAAGVLAAGIAGAVSLLGFGVLTIWLLFRDMRMDTDATPIVMTLSALILTYAACVFALRRAEPWYGVIGFAAILAAGLLRGNGVSYAALPALISLGGLLCLGAGIAIARTRWAEHAIPFWIMGGYAILVSPVAQWMWGGAGASWLPVIAAPIALGGWLAARRRAAAV